MVLMPVRCPYGQSDQLLKRGNTETGQPRDRGQHADGPPQSLLLNPAYPGRLPDIQQQVIEMSLRGRGIGDIARVLQISPDTVINV